jgi:MoxR-like ATPase
MDERRISLPKLGVVAAREGFTVIATQNPREFTATHALSEALLDRFEMLRLDYQTRDEELEILRRAVPVLKPDVWSRTVDLIRATRQHASIKRGASVRAALAICELVAGGMDYATACLMALPSRIEMISSEADPREILMELLENAELPAMAEKKKTRHP